jgi:hypothetical protein
MFGLATRPVALLATGCFALAGLAGCASSGVSPSTGLSAGLNCVNDSSDCLAKRRAALTEIMSDKSAKWIEQPATARADASGVRLFAYKQRRRELDCRQLRIGYLEARGARQRLRAARGTELTPALISRGAILGDEVARDLKQEIRRRNCKPGVS